MIENTSNRDPLINFLGMTDGLRGGNTEAYILGMEAAGQAQFVGNGGDGATEMPTKGPWAELEALGFVRGEEIPGDDMFVKATLPAGWKKVRTDHSMWSKVIDERGIERVAVFYKAAFYDRSAFFRTVNAGHSLASESVYSDDPAKLPDAWGQLTDGEKLDYRTELESRLRDRMDALQYYSDESLAAEQQERINRIRALLALVG